MMATQALSHLVLATSDVSKIAGFFEALFQVSPHFKAADFVEFVLPSKARIAFFHPIGKSALFFSSPAERSGVAFGITVQDIEAVYQTAIHLHAKVSGPPKEHPWGEKSFLLIDVDGNRWEITESPSSDGMLVPKAGSLQTE